MGLAKLNASGSSAAVLTDYFLHPVDGTLIRTGANLILWNLIAFIRDDLGMRVLVHQISPIPRREFRGVAIVGHKAERDGMGMYPELNLSFHRAAGECDLKIYFRWHMGFPRLLPGSVVVVPGIGLPHPAVTPAFNGEAGRREFERRLREVLASAHCLVAQDRGTINALKALIPGYEHRQVYLPPGVDLALFRPAESPSRRSGLRVFCSGDPHIMLHCAGVDLLLYGRPLDFATACRLRCRAAALGRGYCWSPLAHLPVLLRGFDLCLLPGDRTGNTAYYVLPAMASGLPVVAAMGGGLSELVVDGWNGRLVHPGSGENLSAALEELARDGELRVRLGANARRLAEGYPLARWKERWRRLVQEVLG